MFVCKFFILLSIFNDLIAIENYEIYQPYSDNEIISGLNSEKCIGNKYPEDTVDERLFPGSKPLTEARYYSMDENNDLVLPPVLRPMSQALVGKRRYIMTSALAPLFGQGEQETEINCLLCHEEDIPKCRSIAKCLMCEEVMTALCSSIPCKRCFVSANPHFRCIPGEKYMDECNTCRCIDGYSGQCSNSFCADESALNLLVIELGQWPHGVRARNL